VSHVCPPTPGEFDLSTAEATAALRDAVKANGGVVGGLLV